MPDGGVYALTLSTGLAVGFAVPVQPIVKNGTMGLMHIARAGEWKGHPTGEFSFDAKLFDALVERFEARESRALLVDYNHNSERSNEIEAARAGGWIRSLWRKGDGDDAELWAVVEFTAKAADMIAAGELLFCSPVVAWEVADTRTGKLAPELISAALTNQPFQDHLKAIALSRKVELAAPPPAKKPEGEEPAQEDAPPDAEAGTNPPSDEAAGPADPLMSLATQLGVDRQTVCAVVEANLDTFAVAIGQALEKQRTEKQMDVPQTKAPAQQMSADQRIAALEKQLADDRVAAKKALVLSRADALIAEGYGTEHMRDYIVHELSADLEKGAEKIIAAGKVVPVGETQAGDRDQVARKGKVTELNDDERKIHDSWVKHRVYKSQEAVNRLLARRERAGKAA
jgi:hypothetical protein